MDELLRIQLIQAAKAGQLTEEQYAIYLKLLEEDPEFSEDADFEDLIEDALPVKRDEALYEQSERRGFAPEENIFKRNQYAIAASITLLLVAGWVAYFYGFKGDSEPQLISARYIELYNGDDRPESQLGYSEGEIAADELPLKWFKTDRQEGRIRYRFCSDTLQLYVQELSDTAVFNNSYKFTYFTKTKGYFLESQGKPMVKLETCTEKPKLLLK